MAKPSFQKKSEVTAAIIGLESSDGHAIPHINTEDVRLTETIVQVGEMLGISLLDHLVIGQARWVSLKEQKLGFERAKDARDAHS